jgi:prepilin-type N-terminal cleavage/methylation domain-containing protein
MNVQPVHPSTRRRGPAAARGTQRGLSLLEVLVALLLFLAAASGLVLLVNQAYVANVQAQRTFTATSTAQSLLAVVEGNSAALSALNGLQLGAQNPSVSNSTLNPVLNWWKAQLVQYPDLLSLSVSTIPSGSSSAGACNPTAPCQLSASITVRSAFGGSLQRNFVLQDGF